MKIERFFCEFETKSVDQAGVGTFKGEAAVYGNVDEGYDILEPNAFASSLRKFKKKGILPAMTWFHELKVLIGEWNKITSNESSLPAEGMLWAEGNEKGRTSVAQAEMARNMMLAAGPKSLSVGFYIPDYKKDVTFETIKGKNVRRIKRGELIEIAVVPYGMNTEAVITSAKALENKVSFLHESGELKTEREVEQALRDVGLSQSQAKVFMTGGYDSLCKTFSSKSQDLSSVLAAANKCLEVFNN